MVITYDADGHCVKQQRVPDVPRRIHDYFAAFNGPHRAVVESTGCWYWWPISSTLSEALTGFHFFPALLIGTGIFG